MTRAKVADHKQIVLEHNQRFSQSLLWSLQRRFFADQGIAAWSNDTVPHYITNNPVLATAYARIVFGFVRDCLGAATPPLDLQQPLYLMELGAGSGRFAYHFLTKFWTPQRAALLGDLRITYVMTDFTTHNLAYWQAQPAFEQFVAAGLLDFACFDATQDTSLRLTQAGTTLAPDTLTNPLIVVANYVFDSLPQDAFKIEAGQLLESRVTIHAPQAANLDDPATFPSLELSFDHQPINNAVYADPALNRLLAYYQQLGNGHLLFPAAALHCIARLRHIAADRLLLIMGDKGDDRMIPMLRPEPPGLAWHGSFSLSVNYHALGAYIAGANGHVLHSTAQQATLRIMACLLGNHSSAYLETQHAFADAIEQGGPDDFFALKQAIQPNYATFSLAQLLALLRLSGWDATIFKGCLPILLASAENASPAVREDLKQAVDHIWLNYYPIAEVADVPFGLGMLLYAIADYQGAIRYFEHSLQQHGPDPRTTYNLASCYVCLKQWATARHWLDQTLGLDSAFSAAQTLRTSILAHGHASEHASP